MLAISIKFHYGHYGQKCHRRQPHHLTPPTWGAPANNCIYLIFLETRIIHLHFCRREYGLSSFKFVQWASKDASFLQQSAFWPFKVIQGRWHWYQLNATSYWPHPYSTGILCKNLKPWNYFWSIPTYVITVPECHRQTVRRTDRESDNILWYYNCTPHSIVR